MFKTKFKQLTGLLLAAVMTFVALPIQTLASDWGVGDNVYVAMLGNYIGSDGKTYADKYNYDYIYYKSDGSVGVATRYASTHAKFCLLYTSTLYRLPLFLSIREQAL